MQRQVQTGKTIVKKREKPESDSERERVRKKLKKAKLAKAGAVVMLIGLLGFLSVKAFLEWYAWISTREEVIVIPKEPSVEVIDEETGKVVKAGSGKLSTRASEYIADLEEEFAIAGFKIVRARIPKGKMREIDVEVEGVSGFVKVSLDRNAAVTAEDFKQMYQYLEREGKIGGVQYIDIRVERKGYYK